MKFAELEQRALGYQVFKIARREELELQNQKRLQELKELKTEEDARCQEEAEKAQEILEQIQAHQILAVVRDEIWQEGEISPFSERHSKTPRYGIRLISEPYPFITFGRREGILEAKQERSILEVGVATDRIDKKSWLVLTDEDVFDLQSGSSSVNEAVKEYGLEEGLKSTAVLYARRSLSRNSFSTISLNEEVSDNFNEAIVGFVKKRRENKSLPSQIRKWNERVLSELPASLRETGSIGPKELHKWAYGVRGTSSITQVFDGLRGYTMNV